MRLYEIDKSDPTVTALVAVVNQLKQDLEDKEADPNMTLPELINYFKEYDIVLDKSDLYDMIKRPPLKNKIKNIQADNVIFKGQTETPQSTEDESQKVVQQMAKSAMK